MIAKSILAVLPLVGFAQAHGSTCFKNQLQRRLLTTALFPGFWHESMFGFNVTATNSPQYGSRDNRPQAPLKNLPFNQCVFFRIIVFIFLIVLILGGGCTVTWTSHPIPTMYSSFLRVVLQLQSLLATRTPLLGGQVALEAINRTATTHALVLQAN